MSTEEENCREKYAESEKLLKTLAGHCRQALSKYEELKVKFVENQEQYKKITERLQERETQLKNLQGLLQPALTQYTALKEKFEIESVCRLEAENFASKVTKENKVLRRQSQAFLDQHNGDVPVEDHNEFQPYLDELNGKIEELQDEKMRLRTQLDQVHDALENENVHNKAAKKKNESLQAELEHTKLALKLSQQKLEYLTAASETAIKEYEALKGDLQAESICRFKAEEVASKLLRENEVMKRQSAALLGPAMADKKMMLALNEIDNLTTQMMQQQEKYEAEIQELKEQVDEGKSPETVDNLEAEIESLQKERVSLQEQLHSSEAQCLNLSTHCKKLEEQYNEILSKYEEAIRPPPPPPPPPLPEPGSSKSKKSLFARRGSRRKSKINRKLATGGALANEDYTKCINDMMARIKDGKPLKKVLNPVRKVSSSDSSDGDGAMGELNKILVNLKHKRSESTENLSPLEAAEQNSELAQVFRKVKKSSVSDSLSSVQE